MLISAYWITSQARYVMVLVPRRTPHFGLNSTIPILSQALHLEGLLPSQSAFQEHAVHAVGSPTVLSSKGSSDTLYIRGCYQHSCISLHGAHKSLDTLLSMSLALSNTFRRLALVGRAVKNVSFSSIDMRPYSRASVSSIDGWPKSRHQLPLNVRVARTVAPRDESLGASMGQ